MSGSILVGKETSLDVRTVDFLRILNAIRAHTSTSYAAKEIVESVDNLGINMICIDELGSTDFASLYELMKTVRADLEADQGLATFLDEVCQLIGSDERFNRK